MQALAVSTKQAKFIQQLRSQQQIARCSLMTSVKLFGVASQVVMGMSAPFMAVWPLQPIGCPSIKGCIHPAHKIAAFIQTTLVADEYVELFRRISQINAAAPDEHHMLPMPPPEILASSISTAGLVVASVQKLKQLHAVSAPVQPSAELPSPGLAMLQQKTHDNHNPDLLTPLCQTLINLYGIQLVDLYCKDSLPGGSNAFACGRSGSSSSSSNVARFPTVGPPVASTGKLQATAHPSQTAALGVSAWSAAEGLLLAYADAIGSPKAASVFLANSMQQVSAALFGRHWQELGFAAPLQAAVLDILQATDSMSTGQSEPSCCTKVDAAVHLKMTCLHGAVSMLVQDLMEGRLTGDFFEQHPALPGVLLCSATAAVGLTGSAALDFARDSIFLATYSKFSWQAGQMSHGPFAASKQPWHFIGHMLQLLEQLLQLLHGISCSLSMPQSTQLAAVESERVRVLLVIQIALDMLADVLKPLLSSSQLAVSLQQPSRLEQLACVLQVTEAAIRALVREKTVVAVPAGSVAYDVMCQVPGAQQVVSTRLTVTASNGDRQPSLPVPDNQPAQPLAIELLHTASVFGGFWEEFRELLTLPDGWNVLASTVQGQQLLQAWLSLMLTATKFCQRVRPEVREAIAHAESGGAVLWKQLVPEGALTDMLHWINSNLLKRLLSVLGSNGLHAQQDPQAAAAPGLQVEQCHSPPAPSGPCFKDSALSPLPHPELLGAVLRQVSRLFKACGTFLHQVSQQQASGQAPEGLSEKGHQPYFSLLCSSGRCGDRAHVFYRHSQWLQCLGAQ